MTKKQIQSIGFPQNVIAEWIGIEDEDIRKINSVQAEIAIREVCRNARDKKVVELRYKDGKTLDEVSEAIGVSIARSRQILEEMKRIARHPHLLKIIFSDANLRAKYRK